MGQKQRHPKESSNAHDTVRTPTGDARMDADHIGNRTEPEERQAGHQPLGRTSRKPQEGLPSTQR